MLKGLITIAIVIFGIIWGSISLFKSIKLKARLLTYMGATMVCLGFIWATIGTDFLIVLITSTNIENPNGILSILTWIWVPPTIGFSIYVDSTLIIPDKKRILKGISYTFVILGIIWELFIFLDTTNSFFFIEPDIPNMDFYDDVLKVGSPAGIISTVFFLFLLYFCGIGFVYRSIKSTGLLRKKFIFLSLTVLLTGGCGILDGLTSQGITLIFVRLGIFAGLYFWYLSIKEEHIRPTSIKDDEKIKVEESLFRLYKRPALINEEEVTFHREKKICLICKGSIVGFNFTCSNCEALYCIKCSEMLANTENACWVCNAPIDKSKPVELHPTVEEKIDIDKYEEKRKEPKKNK